MRVHLYATLLGAPRDDLLDPGSAQRSPGCWPRSTDAARTPAHAWTGPAGTGRGCSERRRAAPIAARLAGRDASDRRSAAMGRGNAVLSGVLSELGKIAR